MEEKILVKSQQYNVKKFLMIMLIIGAIVGLLMSIKYISGSMRYYDSAYKDYLKHQKSGDCGRYWDKGELCWGCWDVIKYHSKIGYTFADYFKYDFKFCLIPIAGCALLGSLIYLWLRSYELTITDKRIFGKVAWGKRVDLPVDSVSATATIQLFKGVSVSTSSGRISFLMIKNAGEIYSVISNLLIERQQEQKKAAPLVVAAPATSNAGELKQYKELLDSGVISQEEFDAKKKQLLGL